MQKGKKVYSTKGKKKPMVKPDSTTAKRKTRGNVPVVKTSDKRKRR